jgi:hypothetical protein
MYTICWAVKGGSGTTVVAATLALRATCATMLLDLDGDLPAAIGTDEPCRAGLTDWLASDAPTERLVRVAIELGEHVQLVPRGLAPPPAPDDARWGVLARWLAADERHGVIDAGTGVPPAALHQQAAASLLVTRPCYLALRRAAASPITPTGVVLVAEPGRALHAADVAAAVGAPVVSVVSVDPAVARAVDAGLMLARLPRTLLRELRPVA